MAQLPEGLTQKDIDRYAQLDAGIKKLSDEHGVLNEKIKQAHKDAAALEEKHPFEKFPQYWRTQFDKAAVPADVQAKFRTNIIQTLSVSVAE